MSGGPPSSQLVIQLAFTSAQLGPAPPHWARERSHCHVCIIFTWASCRHAWSVSGTREERKQPASCFLARHATGDWGTLDPDDVAENEYGIVHGFRLMSCYQTDASETLWIITKRTGP